VKVIVIATFVDVFRTLVTTGALVDDLSPGTWLIHIRILLLSHSVLTINFLDLALGLGLYRLLLRLYSSLLLFLLFLFLRRHFVVVAGVTCSCLLRIFLNDR